VVIPKLPRSAFAAGATTTFTAAERFGSAPKFTTRLTNPKNDSFRASFTTRQIGLQKYFRLRIF